MGRKIYFRFVLGLTLCTVLTHVLSVSAYASSQNLFALSNVSVISYSPLNPCGFSINTMFAGGPASTCSTEGGAHPVIFANHSPGAANTVTFSTSSAVFVSSLKLFINGDGPANGNLRDIGSFTFSYESSPGVWTVLATVTPSHPEPNVIVLNLTTPVTGQFFRAQFTQYGPAGPRVDELQAFSHPLVTPEPSTVVLLGSGLIAVVKRKLSMKKGKPLST